MNNFPFNFSDINKLMQDFNAFKQNFKGDPKQEVERLLQSGQMTQQQLNELQQTANFLKQFLK